VSSQTEDLVTLPEECHGDDTLLSFHKTFPPLLIDNFGISANLLMWHVI
jgi:hypothetical protein